MLGVASTHLLSIIDDGKIIINHSMLWLFLHVFLCLEFCQVFLLQNL